MSILLFGKQAPRLVDRRRYAKLKKGLRRLGDMKDQIALILGRKERDFELELCEGDNAFISREGQIAIGVELLGEHQENHDLLLGILGHEMGHQPWNWPSGDMSGLTPAQLKALYREEEAKADRFAGRVLAELGGDPSEIVGFLQAHAKGFESQQSNEYYPAHVRAEMIVKAYERRRRALALSRRLING